MLLVLFACDRAVIYIHDCTTLFEDAVQFQDALLINQSFLKLFFLQNADLLLLPEYSLYRPIFRSFLENFTPSSSETIKTFAEVLRSYPRAPRCALLMDEFQKISEMAFIKKDFPQISMHLKITFCQWTTTLGAFRSVSCASAHGLREFEFSAGDEDRRRFIKPIFHQGMADLVKFDASRMLHLEKSRFYTSRSDGFAEEIVNVFGGIPRDVIQAVESLNRCTSAAGGKPRISGLRSALQSTEHEVLNRLLDLSITKWWKPQIAQNFATAGVMLDLLLEILQGNHQFSVASKNLYDFGLIVIQDDGTKIVEPTSLIAAHALGRLWSTFASQIYPTIKPMNGVSSTQRGLNFESNVIAVLSSRIEVNKINQFQLFPMKSVLSEDVVPLKVDKFAESFMLMTSIDSIKMVSFARVLWRPVSETFPCDAIIMPSSTDDHSVPIYLIEVSITSPTDAARVNKKFPGLRSVAFDHASSSQSTVAASASSSSEALVEGGIPYVAEKLKLKFKREVKIILVWDQVRGSVQWHKHSYSFFPDNCFLMDGTACSLIGILV
jgi:hypothetical protein